MKLRDSQTPKVLKEVKKCANTRNKVVEAANEEDLIPTTMHCSPEIITNSKLTNPTKDIHDCDDLIESCSKEYS